jgi:hypothetical protein
MEKYPPNRKDKTGNENILNEQSRHFNLNLKVCDDGVLLE